MSYQYNLYDMNKTLDFFNEGAVCAEIGVWKGDFSKEILKKNPSKLFLVDPWKSITNFPDRWHAAPQDEMDSIYDGVASAFSSDDRVQIIRKLSDDAASDIEDGSLDWIYVDGDHSYEFVKSDLENWWPKLKSGGTLCGDDYQEGQYQVESLDFGIVKAVDEFRANAVDIEKFSLFKDQFVLVKK
jgi:hypothetical protein